MKNKSIYAILLLTIFSLGVRADMIYPYFASNERSELIINGYTKVLIGDSEEVALKKLANPDEIRELYEAKIYKPKVIGKTYWYILQRISSSGSVNEKKEKLVRITFDLQNKVTHVDHWGF